MTREEKVFKLLEAGYNKEDIDSILEPEQEEEAAATSGESLNRGEASESDEEARPSGASQKTTDFEEVANWIKGIKTSIDGQIEEMKKLQKEMQTLNVKTYKVDGDNIDAPAKTTKDVFEEVYNGHVFNHDNEKGVK